MSGRSLFQDTRGRAQVWRLLVAFSLCACLPRAAAQETPKGSDREEVVTVKATLVNLDVTVKDKGGRYVTDLRPEDFTVFENGVRQKVDFFDPPPPPGAGDGPGRPGAPNGASVRSPQAQARNVISLVLDGQTTEQQNLKPLREGTLKYIRERIAETDAVAVFNVAAGLQLLQPFTRDKAKLLSVVERAFGSAASSKTPERGGVAGNVGSRQSELNSLQLAEAGDEFSTSGVVLSRHVEAAGPQPLGTGDMLSHAGVAIRPSPSREFRVADNLVIFFHLYNAGVDGGTGKPLVKVSVRLLADGRDVVKPMAYELTAPAAAPVPHLTFAKFVSLVPLRPGRFTVVVEARDATTGKLLRREEPFTIAP